MKKQIDFRQAVESDACYLNEIRITAIEAVQKKFPHLIGLEQAFDWQLKDSEERIAQFIDDTSRVTDIAFDKDNGKIFGYCVARNNEIERLFIDPSLQGAGIGRQLMEIAEMRIRDQQIANGLPQIMILDSFVTSRPFYERMGFIATWSRKFNLDNSIIHTYWMVKDLTGNSVRPATSDMTLDVARSELDRIDADIIRLLVSRFANTEWVSEYKATHKLPSYDETREIAQRSVLQGYAEMHALPEHLLQYIFGMIRDQAKLNHYHVRESKHFSK